MLNVECKTFKEREKVGKSEHFKKMFTFWNLQKR